MLGEIKNRYKSNETKTWHDWVSYEIHWEMWKKVKFDHTNQWYRHNPAPVLGNDT